MLSVSGKVLFVDWKITKVVWTQFDYGLILGLLTLHFKAKGDPPVTAQTA